MGRYAITSLIAALSLLFTSGTAAVVSGETLPDGAGATSRHEIRDRSSYEKGCLQNGCMSFLWANYGIDALFNNKDFFIGASYEHPLLKLDPLDLNVTMFFYGRPYKKTTYEQTGPTTYRQYKEHRYITGIKCSSKIWLGNSGGIFGGAGYGYTFGSFSGTDEPTRSQWSPMYFGGIFLSAGKMLNLAGGYQFTRIPHSPDHFIFTSLSCNFSFVNESHAKDAGKRETVQHETIKPVDTEKD
ncbi:MAG TPA: hypothetical protein PK253_15795 [Spirochaetota bacterium]|nr:hypothetical protein [Spirochaetota bacterium]